MTDKKDVPRYQVGAQGFFDGSQLHPPGTELTWEAPENWDAKALGPHYMSQGPSDSFIPLNVAAEAKLAEYRAWVAKHSAPVPSAVDERFAKLEKMHLDMMSTMLEQQAENRRLRSKLEEAEGQQKKK